MLPNEKKASNDYFWKIVDVAGWWAISLPSEKGEEETRRRTTGPNGIGDERRSVHCYHHRRMTDPGRLQLCIRVKIGLVQWQHLTELLKEFYVDDCRADQRMEQYVAFFRWLCNYEF